ncbi:MAG: hypothetical protein IJ555_10610 [Ruminococcus sp.]|nr:hypothetical protein [Ruminococcus sp.]
MRRRWYKIYTLSVRKMLGYAKPDGDSFTLSLGQATAQSCMKGTGSDKAENALFRQILSVLNISPDSGDGKASEALSEVIFYADFTRIFDRTSASSYYTLLRKKAETLFRSEGVMIDFGSGSHRYLTFERSQSMSREGVLTFIREDVFDAVNERIMLGMKVGRCQLSKLYAYKGLMFSDGVRIDGLGLDSNSVVVVDDPVYTAPNTDVITVESKDNGAVRRYERVERKQDIDILGFDGEGLVSPYVAAAICAQLGEEHSSFQIRLPFIKGMLHKVNFQDFFSRAGVETLTDIWGVKHSVSEVGVILTKSMVKCLGWLKENSMSWEDYWNVFKRYGHALYISQVGGDENSDDTVFNYQFLSTLSLTSDEFRPADLPDWEEGQPLSDSRDWLTKGTEEAYCRICSDKDYKIRFFTDKQHDTESREYQLAEILRANPKFIYETAYANILRQKAHKLIKDYAIGRLIVTGDNRFLSGDLLELMHLLAVRNGADSGNEFLRSVSSALLYTDSFYAPCADYSGLEYCALLRNPHIARNEEVCLRPYHNSEDIRNEYLGHLTDVVMISGNSLAAARLGGADFDGDMVKIITDEIVNRCVQRNNGRDYPLLMIPSEKPIESDATDWQARFETVISTFSNRVGQISNAALDRSVIAYNENSSDDKRERCRRETETLAILTGLEIDSAKTGVKPDLSEYLGNKDIPRCRFLKYKAMLEKKYNNSRRNNSDFWKKREKFFDLSKWDKINSNLESLPKYAYELSQYMGYIFGDPAPAAELFLFAEKPNWKDGLDKDILDKLDTLINDFKKCISRIMYIQQPPKNKPRLNDISRILSKRGQDSVYEIDELYVVIAELSPERISQIRKELRDKNWQFTRPEEREDMLSEWLPDCGDYYELFSDFRECGCKLLWDLVADIDDENKQSEDRQCFHSNDSEQVRILMTAYVEKPAEKYYRDAVKDKCRELLEQIVSPGDAVKYLEALGKRGEMFELVLDKIPEQVRRCGDA